MSSGAALVVGGCRSIFGARGGRGGEEEERDGEEGPANREGEGKVAEEKRAHIQMARNGEIFKRETCLSTYLQYMLTFQEWVHLILGSVSCERYLLSRKSLNLTDVSIGMTHALPFLAHIKPTQ